MPGGQSMQQKNFTGSAEIDHNYSAVSGTRATLHMRQGLADKLSNGLSMLDPAVLRSTPQLAGNATCAHIAGHIDKYLQLLLTENPRKF